MSWQIKWVNEGHKADKQEHSKASCPHTVNDFGWEYVFILYSFYTDLDIKEQQGKEGVGEVDL